MELLSVLIPSSGVCALGFLGVGVSFFSFGWVPTGLSADGVKSSLLQFAFGKMMATLFQVYTRVACPSCVLIPVTVKVGFGCQEFIEFPLLVHLVAVHLKSVCWFNWSLSSIHNVLFPGSSGGSSCYVGLVLWALLSGAPWYFVGLGRFPFLGRFYPWVQKSLP